MTTRLVYSDWRAVDLARRANRSYEDALELARESGRRLPDLWYVLSGEHKQDIVKSLRLADDADRYAKAANLAEKLSGIPIVGKALSEVCYIMCT